MIKKILCAAVTATLIMTAFTGCGEEKNKTTVIEDSSAAETNGLQQGQQNADDISGIDVKLCAENAQNRLLDKSKYPEMDVSIDVMDQTNSNTPAFNIIIVSTEKPASENDYITWAKDCMAALNEEAIKQNPKIEPAKENYYGGLFDIYSAMLTCTCNDDILTIWPVSQTIEAGTHDPIVINTEPIDLSKLS